MDSFKAKLNKVGKGGVHCQCCNSYKGKEKPKLNRLARRRLKNEIKKDFA